MSDQAYINNSIKELVQINKNFERKYDQHIENVEATQRIIIERISGSRSLLEMNYQEILKNRKEILENRNVIMNGIENIKEKLNIIEEKLNLI